MSKNPDMGKIGNRKKSVVSRLGYIYIYIYGGSRMGPRCRIAPSCHTCPSNPSAQFSKAIGECSPQWLLIQSLVIHSVFCDAVQGDSFLAEVDLPSAGTSVRASVPRSGCCQCIAASVATLLL